MGRDTERRRRIVSSGAPARRRRRRGRSGPGRTEEPAEIPFPEAGPAAPLPIPLPAPVPLSVPYVVESMTAGPSPASMNQEEQKLALFIDIDNVVIGLRESGHAEVRHQAPDLAAPREGEDRRQARLRRLEPLRRPTSAPFHEAAIELIDIPQHRLTGKNSADIRMVVDAMDLA